MINARQTWAFALVALSGLVTGCGPNSQIEKTTEPRHEVTAPKGDKPEPVAAKKDEVATRILGGILPAGEGQSWFFKMMGPTEAVSAQEKAFDAFLKSIVTSGKMDQPVSWTLPEGWRDGPQKGRYATLLAGNGPDALELSVMKLGGGLADNINRWRGQVGRATVSEEELPKSYTKVPSKDGQEIMRVDVSGMAGKGPVMPPFMKGKQ